MTITKNDITISLVKQLIAEQFPQWAHLPINPVPLDGWDNTTFRLGEEMSVRLPSAAAYREQVAKEHHWLPKLGPLLPLPIPVPLAMGEPTAAYPWSWSVYKWLDGNTATLERIDDLTQFATELAQFLVALQAIDPAAGPPPGWHNFFRGGSLTVYDDETRRTIAALGNKIDGDTATAVWETALKATWQDAPVWVHGDVAVGNLLVKDGRLSAVIDFGCSAVGDPACDLVITWTFFFGESRTAFYENLPADEGTWARGRGWALWKALITLAGNIDTNPLIGAHARHVIDEVLSDHRCVTL